MNPIHYLKCQTGWHTPKRALIHFDGEAYRSRCKSCNQRIRRARHNRWHLIGKVETETRITAPR